ncbi:MAG: helicase [Actinobacteria bacterium]|nr:helicase [Actinomycetota bacterium]MCL6105010.1 helicase [Actinomycetota bacterium]
MPGTVLLPLRTTPLLKVEVFLGPTNSGKTHRALEYLKQRGVGVYAAPLRMLALEAYERLSEQTGRSQVGLVTGEERINEHAPIICCTVEMAPMSGRLLVLDEVQWAQDTDRGWAWTRLLAGAEVEELYVTGEIGALSLVRSVLGDDVNVVFLDRLCPLTKGGGITVDNIPNRCVVVAFSRKAVLHLAGLLKRQGKKVSVLYGALPPEVRRVQLHSYIRGETDIVVATDVIGHGINLPVDSVVLAETDKFDGVQRRSLAPWEVAQIAGRAGRYGLSKAGTVHWLTKVPGFSPDEKVINQAFSPKYDIVGAPSKAFRSVTFGYVAPALDDLAVELPTQLSDALASWERLAKKALKNILWAKVADLSAMRARVAILSRCNISPPPEEHPNGDHSSRQRVLAKLSLEDAWRLARSPLDPDDLVDATILPLIARKLLCDVRVDFGPFLKVHKKRSAVILEEQARRLVALRWATLSFPGMLGITHNQVVFAMGRVVDALNLALKRAVDHGVAHCVKCGALCAPWFSMCDDCHRRTQFTRHHSYDDLDDYDDDYDYD